MTPKEYYQKYKKDKGLNYIDFEDLYPLMEAYSNEMLDQLKAKHKADKKQAILKTCFDVGFSNRLEKDIHGDYTAEEYISEINRKIEQYYEETFKQ